MENLTQTEAPQAGELRAHNSAWNTAAELTDAELGAVSGGINPQPLPPRRESHF
jgi:hypothetical protein